MNGIPDEPGAVSRDGTRIETGVKSLAKRSQHFNATSCNIVGHNMLRTFDHPVAICCVRLASPFSACRNIMQFEKRNTKRRLVSSVAIGHLPGLFPVGSSKVFGQAF